MKNFDSRTYSINDFLEWNNNNQLELNPNFQRRSVWNDNARSYLMDTIIRGFPIPKVFIRQKINVITRNSIREVVDGQQRLRTILSYLNDGFTISKEHNPKYGGLYFSQLYQVDDDIQASILNYEISVDLLVNMPDQKVLDVFSRLNSYSVVLNEQEKINANHFGPFKLLADCLSKKYYQFWIDNKVISEKKCLRMDDVNLTADLLIAMCEGIKEKKKIKYYYDAYEKRFDHDGNELESRFDYVMNAIQNMFGKELRDSEFKRVHLFYTLFTAVYHIKYGLRDVDDNLPGQQEIDYTNLAVLMKIRHRLEKVEYIFDKAEDDIMQLSKEEQQFLDNSRRATTDASKRMERTEYLVKLIADVNE